MFDIDLWREIFQSINKNRTRSLLSGFTVAFAILLFTILFGLANGLNNTFSEAFVDEAANAVYIRSGRTTKAHKDFKRDAEFNLKMKILTLLKQNLSPILSLLQHGFIGMPQPATKMKKTIILSEQFIQIISI